MMYSDIEIPSQGDGRTMVLIGNGYYRGVRLAAVHHRIAAALIDLAVFLAVYLPLKLVAAFYWDWSSGYVVWLDPAIVDGLPAWIALAVASINVVFMQAKTGQSFGKMCLGMVLVHPRVDPMNVDHHWWALSKAPMLIFRSLVHFIDVFILIGVIWMAVTQRRESIADKACNTLVLRPHDMDTVSNRIESGLVGARDRD